MQLQALTRPAAYLWKTRSGGLCWTRDQTTDPKSPRRGGRSAAASPKR